MSVSVSEQKPSFINTPEHTTILSPIKTLSKTGSNFQPLILSVVKRNKNKGNKLKDKTEELQTNLSEDSFSSKSRKTQSCCPCQKEIENNSWICYSNCNQWWHTSCAARNLKDLQNIQSIRFPTLAFSTE